MTSTLDRRPPSRPAPPPRRSAPGALLPGLIAAGWALGAGLVTLAVPVLLSWATDSRSGSGAGEATRAAAQLWLLAHGTWLSIPGGAVGLTPLGLLALPLLLLHRAGRHATRTCPVTTPKQATQLALAVAAPYALGAAVVAATAATRTITPDPVRALLGAFLVANLGAGSGVLREARLLTAFGRLPARVRWLGVGTAAATALLVAGGAVVAGLSLAVHAGRATALAGATDPGVVGGVALLLMGLLLVPNAAVWGLSFTAGPGFAVGVGTTVGPFGTSLGAVPAFPLLAALPGGDTPLWLGVLGLGVPIAAGVLAGILVARRLRISSATTAALEASLLGPTVGLAVAALCALSGGPLGGGRLAAVGPSPWKVGLAVAVEVALPAAVAAAVVVRRRR
jgi:hypothetical protein